MDNSTEGGTAIPMSHSQSIACLGALIVEALFIVLGNLVVLAVFGKNRQLRRRKSHWLLINQAVIDLIAGFITGTYWVACLVQIFYPFYDSIDVRVRFTSGAMSIFLPFLSFSNLSMMALERAHAAFRPIKHRALSARNYLVAIVAVWLLPAPLACLFTALHLGKIPLSTFYYISASNASGFFLIVVSSYSSIWMKFKCSPVAPQNDLRAAQERRLTASLFLVTAASSMAFLSGMIFGATTIWNAMSWQTKFFVSIFAFMLLCINYFINPIIYALKMPGFRRAAIRLICGSRPRTANAALPLRTEQRNRGKGRL